MARDARARICEAAIVVAARDGLLAMTLDNVAKEAGVSKGGVMYHFHTKEELIAAMLGDFGQRMVGQLFERIAWDPEPTNRWARNLLACAHPETSGGDGAEGISSEVVERYMLTALAAAVLQPGAIEPLTKLGLELRDRLAADVEGGLDQLLAWLTIDGLFLWRFVGLIRRDDPLFDKILARLRQNLAAPTPENVAPTPDNVASATEPPPRPKSSRRAPRARRPLAASRPRSPRLKRGPR